MRHSVLLGCFSLSHGHLTCYYIVQWRLSLTVVYQRALCCASTVMWIIVSFCLFVNISSLSVPLLFNAASSEQTVTDTVARCKVHECQKCLENVRLESKGQCVMLEWKVQDKVDCVDINSELLAKLAY